MAYANLDDAAEAALFMLSRQKAPSVEHLGAIYGDEMQRTADTVDGNGSHVHGTLSVPRGAKLDALFHNHPLIRSDVLNRAKFSQDDIAQAQRLKIPSYISAGDRTLKFDPATGKTEEVLAAFPWADYKQYLDQRFPQMGDTVKPGNPAVTGKQRLAMVNAMTDGSMPGSAPGSPAPSPQLAGPKPRAKDMGGAPQPMPPGANTFGAPMGAPSPSGLSPEQERAALIAALIRSNHHNNSPGAPPQ